MSDTLEDLTLYPEPSYDLVPPDPHFQDAFEHRWVPLRGSDLFASQTAPPAWLLADLIRQRSLVMISAEPFTGKTMFALSLALALDTQLPFLNHYQPSPGHRALFIGQDAPTWDYQGVFAALTRGLAIESPPNLPSLFILNRGLTLALPRQFSDFLEAAVSLYDIDVLILDVLRSFHDYDENSNLEMSRIMDLLKSFRDRFGLTIILTHHTSKPSAGFAGTPQISGNYRARGASVISGSIDQHFLLRASRGAVQIEMPKARGAFGAPQVEEFTIISSSDHVGNRSLSLAPSAPNSETIASSTADLLRTASPSDQISVRSIYNVLRSRAAFAALTDQQVQSRLSAALRVAERRGAIRRLSHGLYRLTPLAAPQTP